MYRKYIKRFLDIILSLIAIIILSPLLIVIAVIVRVKLGSPVLFKQERVGKNEKLFTMYKFRTMTIERDNNGDLLPDSERITKFGSFLRSTSLDELPELFNIVKGDISIIGPRPLPVSYLKYYTNEEKRRHNVRGGLTIPEVLSGKITPTWEEQFKCEVDYVDDLNFFLDLKIIIATFSIIIKRIGGDYGNEERVPLSEERNNLNDLISYKN